MILAGYADRMETFFRSNPGMGSRVAHHIDFPDYNVDELMAIARLMLEQQAYELDAGGRARRCGRTSSGACAAALRQRAQHPQRDRPRAAAPGDAAVRRGGALDARRPDDDRGRGHPAPARSSTTAEPAQDRAADARRPIILGVVGDSAAGKTTITRGLVRVLGEDQVTHIAADDYHRYDRKQRAERGITPLDPECNYIDIMEQHLRHVRAGSRS